MPAHRRRSIKTDDDEEEFDIGQQAGRTKGGWSHEEDTLLIKLVKEQGEGNWSGVSRHFPGRIGKQCRERWHNQLRPDIRRDAWQPEEEQLLIDTHRRLGNKWADIAKHIPGRTENSVKNHWNATLRKKEGGQGQSKPLSLLKQYLNSLSLGTGKRLGKRKSTRDNNNNNTSRAYSLRNNSYEQQSNSSNHLNLTTLPTPLGTALPLGNLSSQKQPTTPEADGLLDWLTNANHLPRHPPANHALGVRDNFRTPDPLGLLASPLLSPRTAGTELHTYVKTESLSLFEDASPDFLGIHTYATRSAVSARSSQMKMALPVDDSSPPKNKKLKIADANAVVSPQQGSIAEEVHRRHQKRAAMLFSPGSA